MQATQSCTASGAGIGLPHFAALRPENGSSQGTLDGSEMVDLAAATPDSVAEGAGLAHDAGNLLGALNLYADLLSLPGVLPEEHRQYADELRLLGERSRELIERLIRHARPDSFAASRGATVLPEVVERCAGLLSRIAGREVETEFGPGSSWPVGASVEAVERILTNLVKNAGEALRHGGSEDGQILIHVEAVVEGAVPKLVLAVTDTGCGMSEEELWGLRGWGQPAQRSDSVGGRRRGLGLRVVRELTALSGGCLHIGSELGLGTTVAVEWNGVARHHERRPMRLVKAEAGWIAC
jgi:signal transduction histidine kinase